MLVLAAPARAANETPTPEEDHGCGTGQNDNLAGTSQEFCRRYGLLKQWYSNASSQYSFMDESNACDEFAKASAKLRGVICAYAKESVAYLQAREQYQARNGGQNSHDGDASKLAAEGSAIHDKYEKLLTKNQDEQLTKFLALQDALKKSKQTITEQLRKEAYSCTGGAFGPIPGPWLASTNYLTEKESNDVERTFQNLATKAKSYSMEKAGVLGEVSAITGLRGSNMATAGTEPPSGGNTSVIKEDAITVATDRTATYGTEGLVKVFVKKFEGMAIADFLEKYGVKYGGPLAGFAGSVGVQYFRNGHVEPNDWLNAFCGIPRLAFGLLCSTVLSLGEMDKERRAQYGRFADGFLRSKPKATSAEVSQGFCDKVAKDTADAAQKAAADAAARDAQRSQSAELIRAHRQEFEQDWSRIRGMGQGKDRDDALAAFRAKWKLANPS